MGRVEHALRMAVGQAPPLGSLTIFCRVCKGERPAVKRHGPLPGSKRCWFVWWNVCCDCDTHFVALPPGITERHRVRMYERRSGQLSLLSTNNERRPQMETTEASTRGGGNP